MHPKYLIHLCNLSHLNHCFRRLVSNLDIVIWSAGGGFVF